MDQNIGLTKYSKMLCEKRECYKGMKETYRTSGYKWEVVVAFSVAIGIKKGVMIFQFGFALWLIHCIKYVVYVSDNNIRIKRWNNKYLCDESFAYGFEVPLHQITLLHHQ